MFEILATSIDIGLMRGYTEGEMTKVITVEGKRPADATPERALELAQAGLTQAEIGRRWHISRQRVSQLIAKAKPSA